MWPDRGAVAGRIKPESTVLGVVLLDGGVVELATP
jgi:hypothetical protein